MCVDRLQGRSEPATTFSSHLSETASYKALARLTAVVVFSTPPFLITTEIVLVMYGWVNINTNEIIAVRSAYPGTAFYSIFGKADNKKLFIDLIKKFFH